MDKWIGVGNSKLCIKEGQSVSDAFDEWLLDDSEYQYDDEGNQHFTPMSEVLEMDLLIRKMKILKILS